MAKDMEMGITVSKEANKYILDIIAQRRCALSQHYSFWDPQLPWLVGHFPQYLKNIQEESPPENRRTFHLDSSLTTEEKKYLKHDIINKYNLTSK